MTQFLPPNLLALFAPRDPIQFLPPVDKLPHEKKTTGYTGLGGFLNEFEVSFFLRTHFCRLCTIFPYLSHCQVTSEVARYNDHPAITHIAN